MKGRINPIAATISSDSTEKNILGESTNQLVIDCAELSLRIYDNPPPPSVKGWKLLHQSGLEDAYRGACYYNDLSKPLKIVFVHRGTVPKYVENIWSDIQLAVEDLPETHFKLAMNFVNFAWSLAVELFTSKQLKDALVIQAGHSLGAATANLCHIATAYIEDDSDEHTLAASSDPKLITSRSITFENPGARPLAAKYLKKINTPEDNISGILQVLDSQCTTYQARPNVINTCNQQIGDVYVMDGLPYQYDINPLFTPDFPVSPSFRGNSFYLASNTQDQHPMAHLFKYLEAGGDLQPRIGDYPFGFQQGYYDYLCQVNWDEYFKEIWDRKPEIHKEYEYSFDKCSEDFYLKLQNIRDKAQEIFNFSIPKGTAKILPMFNQSVQQKNVNIAPFGEFVVMDNTVDAEQTDKEILTASFCRTM